MVFLGLEKPVEYGRQQIFDPTTAQMVLQAQDQYANALYRDYVRGLEDMKEFNKEYGNFMTPFGADQEWYNKNVIDKVRGTIQRMYEAGIDPTRSVQGRAAISQLINSVDVGTVNAMKDNAKIGYAYLDAMQDLRRKGKYSEAQELFDIMQTGGTNFKDFATRGPNGQLNMWDRSSPIEATSLLDLTFDSYKNRTPRDLTADDLRASGIPYDPRYQYTGYLDSDLMKVAPGAAMSIAADPRAAYFRNLAEQKVAARGGNYTQADVDAQFYRDIADANKWALVDPTKKVDEYAKMAQQNAYARDLENLRAKNDKDIAMIKAAGSGNGGGYSATTNMASDAEGTLLDNIANFSNQDKMDAPNREFGQIGNLFMDVLSNPDRYSNYQRKYITNRAKQLGIDQLVLNGDPRKAKSVEITRRISIGLEGVADEISKISKGYSWHNKAESVNKMNNILHDVSSNAAMSTVNGILKEFGTVSEDGGVTLSTNYNRLCGVGSVITDLLSRANADGRKHSKVDAALKHFQESGNLKYSVNSWTAGSFDSRNNTDDWFPDNKVYPTGNVVAGDKYYYIEVSNDPTDNSECCWFKVERDSEHHGGVNQVLSSITQQVDDKFLHEYSHTNVLGNPQSVVQKHNK